MTFHTPGALWVLLAVPVFVGATLFAWRARKRTTRSLGDPGVIEGLVAGRGAAWRAARATLFAAGTALLVVALAGPEYGQHTRMLRKRGVDLVIALDMSKSMLAEDVSPSRIARAKREIAELTQGLGGDRVGLVAFAGDTMPFPMTTDYAALELFLRGVGPLDMPVGGTDIGAALDASRRLLEAGEHPADGAAPTPRAERPARVVVLITDGGDHAGDVDAAAKRLADAGIKLYTVGVGTAAGGPIPVRQSPTDTPHYVRDQSGRVVITKLSGSDAATLARIASETGGRYLNGDSGGSSMNAIAGQLATLQQAENQARKITVREHHYLEALLPAFVLLLIEGLLPEAWLGRRRRRARVRAEEVAA